jgi:protein-tyrosine-phosphatase
MKILFVCSGNTCRSPLAAAILTEKLAAQPALSGVTVASAGTNAWEGSPASEGSYLIALERGLDLSAHRARLLTGDLVRDADLILGMSDSHVRRATDLGGGGKSHNLVTYVGGLPGQRDVPDPVGGDVAGYRQTGDFLDTLLTRLITKLAAERRS